MPFQEEAMSRRLGRREGERNWIRFGSGAAIALQRTSAGLRGTFVLLGNERRKATAVLRLLAAYDAARHARVVDLEGKPKSAQILGLEFLHERHLRTVVRALRERQFPPLVGASASFRWR